jgi:CDP-diacylglycerol--glycerol-3-phosphate 3-phosphatidyltransferase
LKPNQLMKENIYTVANCATLIRTVIGGTCFYMAFASHSEVWNYAGLLTHWILDVADGSLARSLKQETILGAQFDILTDRLLITFFYLNYLIFHPANLLIVILFLLEFTLLDHYLSNQFLNWGIISPNYFYQVDRLIWNLNWSAPGKFINSGMVTILLITTNAVMPVLIVVLLLIAVKVFSFARLQHLVQALPS